MSGDMHLTLANTIMPMHIYSSCNSQCHIVYFLQIVRHNQSEIVYSYTMYVVLLPDFMNGSTEQINILQKLIIFIF